MKSIKLHVFDSFGKNPDSANIDTQAAAENLNSPQIIYHFDKTAKGQKKMDKPGEPIVSEILRKNKQAVSIFKVQQNAKDELEDLDIDLENDTFDKVKTL